MKCERSYKHKKGFTLIELLISISIFGLLVGISIPLLQSFQVSSQLDDTTQKLVQTLHRGQLRSMSMDQNSVWSISTQDRLITLFKGTDYSTRDVNYDEVYELPTTINISGLSQISFSKLDGKTINTGNIVLRSVNTEEQSISINSNGVIEY